MAAVRVLVILWASFGSLAAETQGPLQVAARTAGCGAETDKLSCLFAKLFAPSEEQAAAAKDPSIVPNLPQLPIPSAFEGLLNGGAALFDVPLNPEDVVAVLGSAAGRLPLVAFLQGLGGHSVGVEKDPVQHARALLALRRLRDFLHAYGAGLVDGSATCADQAAKGDCTKDPSMASRCPHSCYNRTQPSLLEWKGRSVSFLPHAQTSTNLSLVTVVILEQDGASGAADRAKELAPVTAKLEAELAPGSVVWSVDPLRLRGATMQEAEPSDPPEEGKPAKKPVMITVPAGGLVFLRRFHVAAQWSLDVPFHVHLRVPAPPASLRPAWPISIETATQLQRAATEELQRLGAMRLSGAVLSEMRFTDASVAAYGARETGARRLARAFGSPVAALGSVGPDWCRCRPRKTDQAFEVGALSLLAMFLLSVHSPGGQCAVPPCTAADKLVAVATAELRKQLLSGNAESADLPPQVLRDLGCLRLSDQRTLLHAAVGRKDLQLARAVLRSQGHGGLFCRDSEGRTVLHHAAAGGNIASTLEGREANMSGALQPRVNASTATEWVLSQMKSHAVDMVSATDAAGRTAVFAAEDTATLRLLAEAPQSLDLFAADTAGRSLVWYAAALKRKDILAELLCEPGDLPPNHTESNDTVTLKSQSPKAKKALEAGSQDPSASPFLAAARQHAGLRCASLGKAPDQVQQTLDVLAYCGGQRPEELNVQDTWLTGAKRPSR